METVAANELVSRLGAVLRNERKKQELTQAQLATKAHVSRNFVVNLECGHSRAKIGKVLLVFEALGANAETRISLHELIEFAFDASAGTLDQEPSEKKPHASACALTHSAAKNPMRAQPETSERSGSQTKTDSMALIEKGQQLAGHFPTPAAMDRAQRVLSGKTSLEDGRRELAAKYKRT